MNFTYLSDVSIPTTRPPVEPGLYAVQFVNGTTGTAIWDERKWTGTSVVERYSGRPLLLTRDEKTQHIANIRAGMDLPKHLNEHLNARRSALALARHHATKMEQVSSDDKSSDDKILAQALNMYGYYLIARAVGVSFDVNDKETLATTTDIRLLEWAYKRVDSNRKIRIQAMVNGKLERGPDLQTWLEERLNERS